MRRAWPWWVSSQPESLTINQPLGAILSNADTAELLLDRDPSQLDEVRQILIDIRRDDLRASEVIRHMRTLLRKRELELQPLDLNRTINDVVRLLLEERASPGHRPEHGTRDRAAHGCCRSSPAWSKCS